MWQPRAEQHQGTGVLGYQPRAVEAGATWNLELRIEAFNLFNPFNWGSPGVNINASTFGRIQTRTGEPRIMQFGIKHGF